MDCVSPTSALFRDSTNLICCPEPTALSSRRSACTTGSLRSSTSRDTGHRRTWHSLLVAALFALLSSPLKIQLWPREEAKGGLWASRGGESGQTLNLGPSCISLCRGAACLSCADEDLVLSCQKRPQSGGMASAPRCFGFSQATLFVLPTPSARSALRSQKGTIITPPRTANAARLRLQQTSSRELQTADPSDGFCSQGGGWFS